MEKCLYRPKSRKHLCGDLNKNEYGILKSLFKKYHSLWDCGIFHLFKSLLMRLWVTFCLKLKKSKSCALILLNYTVIWRSKKNLHKQKNSTLSSIKWLGYDVYMEMKLFFEK